MGGSQPDDGDRRHAQGIWIERDKRGGLAIDYLACQLYQALAGSTRRGRRQLLVRLRVIRRLDQRFGHRQERLEGILRTSLQPPPLGHITADQNPAKDASAGIANRRTSHIQLGVLSVECSHLYIDGAARGTDLPA